MVEIKKKKNSPNSSNTMKLDAPKIYEPMENINKNLNNIQDELSPQSKNKLNEDIFKRKEKPLIIKRKRKKKIKSKNTMDFPNSQIISFNLKTAEKDKKGIDKNNIFNQDKNINSGVIENMVKFEVKMDDHETDKEYENKRIINKIKMKCYCVYFWFCFARKKKNIQNLLIDEGMKVIIEKLDIINIFKKIYSTEYIEKALKIKGNMFEMSDICKKEIEFYK